MGLNKNIFRAIWTAFSWASLAAMAIRIDLSL